MRINSKQSAGALYKKIYELLTDKGIPVNSTSGYPRVEISSISEGEPVSKDGSVRTTQAVIDSMSSTSYGEASELDNLSNEVMSSIDRELVDNGDGSFFIIGVVTLSCINAEDYTDSQEHLYRYTRTLQFFLEDY